MDAARMTEFRIYKATAQYLLRNAGWTNRGVFKAFKAFDVWDAFDSGEPARDFVKRVDRDAPLGMAS